MMRAASSKRFVRSRSAPGCRSRLAGSHPLEPSRRTEGTEAHVGYGVIEVQTALLRRPVADHDGQPGWGLPALDA